MSADTSDCTASTGDRFSPDVSSPDPLGVGTPDDGVSEAAVPDRPSADGNAPAADTVPVLAPSDAARRGGCVAAWSALTARLPVRFDPGRRSALAIGIAVALAAVLTGAWVLSSQPQSMPVTAPAPTALGSPLVRSGTASHPLRSSSGSVAGSSTAAGEVVVDVAGKVRSPGLYRLAPGSRVDDAVRAAGGVLRGVDLTSINLAAKIADGQHIIVGGPPTSVAAGGGASGSAAGGTSQGPVNLNTATLEQLETLPGVGPALGQRILDYRSAHGSFATVDQLDNVSGIGAAIFARLKPLVTT